MGARMRWDRFTGSRVWPMHVSLPLGRCSLLSAVLPTLRAPLYHAHEIIQLPLPGYGEQAELAHNRSHCARDMRPSVLTVLCSALLPSAATFNGATLMPTQKQASSQSQTTRSVEGWCADTCHSSRISAFGSHNL